MREIPWRDVDDAELSDEQITEKYALEHYGPVWERNADGSWVLPERTLGWQIALWCSDYLNPLGSDQDVFAFTLEQLRFVLWLYAVDESGGWVYPRRATLQRIKGWGKDPLLAVICLVEAFGPSRFSHFDAETGEPVGVRCPNALVQVFALKQEQTRNTFDMFPVLVSPQLKADYGVDMGIEIIRGLGNTCRIESKTSSPRSAEGNRATFAVLNETQHWLETNGGHFLLNTVEGNLSKMRGRYVSITNAPKPGEDSVAERARAAYMDIVEGRSGEVGVLYDTLEAPSHTPLDERVFRIVYERVRGDSVWLDADSAWSSVMNPSRPTSESRRMFLNQVWQPEEALYPASLWDSLFCKGTVEPGDKVVLGFDGGKTDDATALVAMRVSDGLLVPLLLEEAPADLREPWEVNRERVDAAVHRAFRDFEVVGFFADVALWESYIYDWQLSYGRSLEVKASEARPIEWDMRGSQKRTTLTHERFMDAIFNGKIRHGGSRDLSLALRRHVLNVRRKDTPYGVSFMKESRRSKKKIDLYAASMLAFAAYQQYHEELLVRGRPDPVGGEFWKF